MASTKPNSQDHPISFLRRILFHSSILALFFSLISTVFENWWDSSTWLFTMVVSCASILVVRFDLYDWKHHHCSTDAVVETMSDRCMNSFGGRRKRRGDVCAETDQEVQALLARRGNGTTYSTNARDGDTITSGTRKTTNDDSDAHYRWPRKSIMIIDFFLTIAFAWIWFLQIGSIESIGSHYYSFRGALVLVEAYCNVCTVLSTFWHAKCWWREFMARKKQRWEDDKEQQQGDEDELESGKGREYCHCCRCCAMPSFTTNPKCIHDKKQLSESMSTKHDENKNDDGIFTPSSSSSSPSSSSDSSPGHKHSSTIIVNDQQ